MLLVQREAGKRVEWDNLKFGPNKAAYHLVEFPGNEGLHFDMKVIYTPGNTWDKVVLAGLHMANRDRWGTDTVNTVDISTYNRADELIAITTVEKVVCPKRRAKFATHRNEIIIIADTMEL